MTSSKKTRSSGFTLIEILVVLTLTGIVAVGLYQMLFAGRRSHDMTRNQVEMQQNARVAINALAEDFRHVSYGKDPTQPSIHYAGPDSIVFIADLMPEIPGAEIFAFYLDPEGDLDTPNPDDTILIKSVSDSSGTVLYTAPQSYGISNGGLSLRYFNGSGVELENPVPQPELIGEMAIEITATESQRFAQQAYSTMTLSATVYPRNLPLSPARSRPSTPLCYDPTYPNCNSATLTWDTPTTNTDGTELPLADISHFNIYYGPSVDQLDLTARVARTINSWTFSDLECDTYFSAVTCVSRSGVESYQCRQPVSATGGIEPKAPSSITLRDSLGVKVDWPQVTQFIDDQPITVQVDYYIYRSETAGFLADASSQIGSVSGVTDYLDTGLPSSCSTYYYKVRAMVCCSLGAESPEGSIARPSPPGCPTNLAGSPGAQPGEIDVTWSHPLQREDLTDLPIEEINGTCVYYDTIPGSSVQSTVVAGIGTSTTLTGLQACKTYYVRARTIDQCGHYSGGTCLGNEIAVTLTAPCDPELPAEPAWLNLDPLDNRVDLTWPANTTDCDLGGYRIYYGYSTGDYSGTGAAEGNSPIDVTVSDVTVGGNCLMSLTNLEGCAEVFAAVACIDQCTPPQASPQSPEASGLTTCNPCEIQASCPTWATTSISGYSDVHLEVYTSSAGDETLARLIPTWNSGASVIQVLYGRPLVQIWNENGTAGQDGPVGPQPSGATLDLDDQTVPVWTTLEDGQPLTLVFDQDVRDLNFGLEFRNPSGGNCTASDVSRGTPIFDDFDDGDINGWSVVGGSWSSDNGELYQSDASGSPILIGSDNFTDLTYEGKIKITSGTTAYFVFRYKNTSNFYLIGIRSDTDVVRLGRYRGGSFSQRATYSTPIDPDTWYNLKVVVTDYTARVYFGCNLVIEHTDSRMESTGKIGFRTYYTATRYDDVRCQNVALLP